MRACVFASGSSGNCALVSHDGVNVLIDAGISMRRINSSLKELGLSLGDVSALLITHAHSDHISGVNMISRYYHVPVFACERTAAALACTAPEGAACLRSFQPGETFEVGPFCVETVATPHDCEGSVGYRLGADGRSFSIVTDLGFVTKNIYNTAAGSDTAVVEMNHDVQMLRTGPYPEPLKRRILSERGHLSNEEGARLAAALVQAGARRIILGHLSRENNTRELALEAARSAVEAAGAEVGKDVEIVAAPPFGLCGPYIV